jgi:nitrogen fixation protein FixH
MNPPPVRRNPWPLGIVVFFGLFLSATVGLVVFSTTQQAELVSRDYYQQELQYQGQIERLGRTQRFRAEVAVGYDPSKQEITLRLPADHARRHPAGTIRFYRPSAASLDHEVRLAVSATGAQTVDARGLQPGLWKVRVLWAVDGQEYYFDQRVVVRTAASRG